MQLIKSIEIRYLRSIHRLRLDVSGDLVVFSGANDVGKSNILKSLNLFFNNEVDRSIPINFDQDFSLRRRSEVRRESIKGKQFIRIDVEFIRPSNYEGSLPPTFTVTKTWLRDSLTPQETNNLDQQEKLGRLPSSKETARRMLSQFLNRIKFDYIPAIRDRMYFEYVLDNLQETLLTTETDVNDPILKAVNELNINLQKRGNSLTEDFKSATGIEANVSLPVDPSALFQAFSVSTKWNNRTKDGEEEEAPVSLSLRGDGIQARYIASLLSYIAGNSSLFHIWGFEEPENSIEYNRAIELANEFSHEYTKRAQIFVSSHSPAFVTLTTPNTISYRIYKVGNTTEAAQIHPHGNENELDQLSEDIGLFKIQKEIYSQYLERRNEILTTQKEVARLQEELSRSTRPIIYVEGKTDELILKTAWVKLYSNTVMPFDIKNCDPLAGGNGGAGGFATLAKFLSTVRLDNPHFVIGMFDQDVDGIKAFNNLPNYFTDNAALNAKVSQNGKAAAFLLPIPEGKNDYARVQNLCIEFYFSDGALSQKTKEGLGLVLKQPNIETKVNSYGGPVLDSRPSDLPYTRQIGDDGKTVFAEQIVPNLDTTEFVAFKTIFEKIEIIITTLAPSPPSIKAKIELPQ